MNVNDEYIHFVALVSGENPEEQMKEFDKNKESIPPVVVYRYKDAPEIRRRYINLYKALLDGGNLNETEYSEIKMDLDDITEMTDDEFFYDLTEGEDYEYDPDTGDAITTKNPNGKWLSYNLGKNFSVPFILNNGKLSYSARKCEIDWSKAHRSNEDVYRAAWELVMEGKKPSNEEEELIYNNMKNRTQYFLKFGNKETYVTSCSSFWAFAFLKDGTWSELEDNIDQFDWMSNFYDRFIKNLPDDTLLTIYECRRE